MANTQNKLFDKFSSLAYEPVFDSDSAVYSWIKSHKSECFTSFIDGQYLNVDVNSKAFDSSKIVIKNPINSSDLTKLIKADEIQVKNAISACVKSFEDWKCLPSFLRGQIIYNIARNIQKNMAILCSVEAISSARSSREVKDLDIATLIQSFYYYAGSCSIENEAYVPVGVCALYGHCDSSLVSIGTKLACALATGNTCLIIPHHITPLGVFMLTEICVQSGVPAGVLNVIVSDNLEVLKQISKNPKINCICYDGPTNVGQDLIKIAAVDVNKKCLLSLNGKSVSVIYDNADRDSAVEAIVDGCFYANGQHRHSLNKVLVQENIYDDLLDRLKNRFEKVRAGSSLDKCNDYGQFINPNEMKTLKDKLAELKFAQVLQFDDCIKDRNLKNLQAPVIITDLETNTDFYQEDINGPYVIVVPFRTVKESIDLINLHRSCGAVSLWSQDISLTMEAASSIQLGTVWINSFAVEKGVQVRKMTGNYSLTGAQSLLNFQKPRWESSFESLETTDFDADMKSFGAADAASTILKAESLVDVKTYKLYIGGKQARPDTQSSRNFYIKNTDGTKSLHALLPDSSRKDVRNAVEAAQASFNDWRKRTNHNKAQIIYYFGENLSKRRDEYVKILETHTKKAKKQCEHEFDLALKQIFFYASQCGKYVGKMNDSTDNCMLMEMHEPLGCIAIVCGTSHYPLLSFIVHAIGAIANGNSVVVVVDEQAPFPVMDLYEVFETSDMPGVVNVLSGNKHHLTKYLSEHQAVNSLWYMADNDNKSDLTAMRFVKYTSNFNLKTNWFINTVLFKSQLDANFEQFLVRDYAYELKTHCIQYNKKQQQISREVPLEEKTISYIKCTKHFSSEIRL